MARHELLTRMNVQAWDAEKAGLWHVANTLREAHRILSQRLRLVRDNDGHEYVIPERRSDEFSEWLNIDSDDPRAWEVPDFAKPVNGSLTFADPAP